MIITYVTDMEKDWPSVDVYFEGGNTVCVYFVLEYQQHEVTLIFSTA